MRSLKTFILLALISVQSWAAITLTAHTKFAGNTTSSGLNTSACTNCLAVAWVIDFQANTGTFSSTPSNTWTASAICKSTDLTNNIQIKRYYAKNATTDAAQTFTLSGGVVPMTFVQFFSGTDTTSPSNGDFSCVGTASTCNAVTCSAGPITPPQNNAVLVSGFGDLNTTISVNSPFTASDVNDTVGGTSMGGGAGYDIQTTAAAATATWNDSDITNAQAITIESFKPSAAPTGTNTPAHSSVF